MQPDGMAIMDILNNYYICILSLLRKNQLAGIVSPDGNFISANIRTFYWLKQILVKLATRS